MVAKLPFDPGLAAGILFIAVTLVEIFARPGFNIHKHAISVLSLGERGWVMVAVFIVSGLLTLLSAYGLFAASGPGPKPWGALLLGVYGIGLILAGVFPAPAGLGFPPGTPEDQQPVMDRTAVIHSIAFMLAFGSLILACLVFAVQFFLAGATGWALLSAMAGIAMPVLIGLGVSSKIPPGIAFYLATVIAWTWFGAVELHLKGKGLSALAA